MTTILMINEVPYWGKLRQGKVTIFLAGDENKVRPKISPTLESRKGRQNFISSVRVGGREG